MSEKDRKQIEELTIDEWIWVVFIVLSSLNIFGDELEKEFCIKHEDSVKSTAKKIFTITVFVSFLIYIYLGYKNYKKYHEIKMHSGNTSLVKTRFFASLLVVIASFLFLNAQLKDAYPVNPSIE